MATIGKPPASYWATNLYLNPRERPRVEAPLRDLSSRAAGRFRRAREGLRALKHVTEQVVYLGTTWKWVWMYEVGGRKLGFLHPMESGASATFVLTEAEERELVPADGLPRVIRHAVRDGVRLDGLRWCWLSFTDLGAVDAFVDVIRMKHHFLSRPD
jgi:hypothetical protein